MTNPPAIPALQHDLKDGSPRTRELAEWIIRHIEAVQNMVEMNSESHGMKRGRVMRYRLRTLMLLTLLVAVLAGCYHIFVAVPYQREVRKMAELSRMGATYTTAPRGPSLLCHVSGSRRFQRITRVRCEACTDDRRLLAVVERCQHLECLKLFRSRGLHPKDFDRLNCLRHLTDLGLYWSDIDDEGLAYIGQINSLDMLSLEATGVTDTGLAHLAGLENLRSLSLNGTSITDKGLMSLASLKRLETLSLRGTEVTDNGMQVVESLPNLRRLELRMNIDYLRGVTSFLPEPFPNSTRVTQERVTEMRDKMPKLRIQW